MPHWRPMLQEFKAAPEQGALSCRDARSSDWINVNDAFHFALFWHAFKHAPNATTFGAVLDHLPHDRDSRALLHAEPKALAAVP